MRDDLEGTTMSINGGPEVPASVVRDALRVVKGGKGAKGRRGSRMKETAEDQAERDRVYDGTGRELMGFITEIEKAEAEKAEVQDHIKAIYERANSRGFDKKALKVIVAERKADPDELSALHAVLDTYRAALGM